MREIKFRAWDGDCMWNDSDLLDLQYSTMRSPQKNNDWILMQYTGLKDKTRTEEFPSGKEIYEGDIVEWPHLQPEANEVYYNSEEVHYYTRPLDKDREMESYLDSQCVIIGNIYENPELLKK